MFIDTVRCTSINYLCHKWIIRQMSYLRHSCGCTKWNLCLPEESNQNFFMSMVVGEKKKKKIKDITLLFPDPLRFHQTSRADQAERHQFVCNNLKYAGTCYLRRSKLQLGQARLAVKSAFQGWWKSLAGHHFIPPATAPIMLRAMYVSTHSLPCQGFCCILDSALEEETFKYSIYTSQKVFHFLSL